jgi:hypothetical protein
MEKNREEKILPQRRIAFAKVEEGRKNPRFMNPRTVGSSAPLCAFVVNFLSRYVIAHVSIFSPIKKTTKAANLWFERTKGRNMQFFSLCCLRGFL